MPRKPARGERRANTGLIVLSVLVIGSLTLSAVISLVAPVEPPPTPTPPFFVTVLPITAPTFTPDFTPTPTVAGPAPQGPAIAPTQ
jgi:hypothetical protein